MLERKRLPDERQSITKRFELSRNPRANVCPACKHQWDELRKVRAYVTVGLYEDGLPGELFLSADKVGSTAHGFMNALAMAISVGLQYGIPLHVYVDKLRGTRFDAWGQIDGHVTSSLLDAIAKWLHSKFTKEPT